jgi:hypothetical protein
MAVVFGFVALHKKQGPAPLTGCTDLPWRLRLSGAAAVDRLARSLPSGQRTAAVISE